MTDIKKLIEQTIVIEGLLRNIEAQDGNIRPEYFSLLNEKFDELQEAYYTVFSPNTLFGESHNEEVAEMAEVVEDKEEVTPPLPQMPAFMDEPQPQQPRVDEVLSIRKAENLSQAFTINDKYRFGRDLYNCDNDKLNNDIKAVQELHSFQQAFDYLMAQNNWDPENQVVQEFLAIISRHFQQQI